MDGEPAGPGGSGPASEQFWYDYLTRGDATERRVRGVFKLIPAAPRCQLCAAPFAGLGARFMRAIGKRPSGKNPRVCNSCFEFMERHHGGAEIEATFLFADIRGSTAIAERIPPRDFSALLDRFYTVASQVVFAHDGSVDKFVGDELVAAFFPLMSGDRHGEKAIEAAVALLDATGHRTPKGPWVPVGAGVHTGMAWVGAVGDASHTELTAVGDTVNTTARLAAAAGAGEVLVSVSAAESAGIADPGLERRSLELKGKQVPTEVVVLRADARPVVG
ncbi:MAG TPA: adenylate/guanylate cyclase domain-containing protein [Candidatus Limnocylindrales bacterium]|nr:adenylate/guanylate cyclase domain-containing protein [Candidatus Limnocylindrales bacterium]